MRQCTLVIGFGFGLALCAGAAAAQTTPPMVIAAQPQRMQGELGGGFIEFLFGGKSSQRAAALYYAPPSQQAYVQPAQPRYVYTGPAVDPRASRATRSIRNTSARKSAMTGPN